MKCYLSYNYLSQRRDPLGQPESNHLATALVPAPLQTCGRASAVPSIRPESHKWIMSYVASHLAEPLSVGDIAGWTLGVPFLAGVPRSSRPPPASVLAPPAGPASRGSPPAHGFDDAADRRLTKGWHRELDPEQSKPWEPIHTHGGPESLMSGEIYEFDIKVVPTANLFKAGSRIRAHRPRAPQEALFPARGGPRKLEPVRGFLPS